MVYLCEFFVCIWKWCACVLYKCQLGQVKVIYMLINFCLLVLSFFERNVIVCNCNFRFFCFFLLIQFGFASWRSKLCYKIHAYLGLLCLRGILILFLKIMKSFSISLIIFLVFKFTFLILIKSLQLSVV